MVVVAAAGVQSLEYVPESTTAGTQPQKHGRCSLLGDERGGILFLVQLESMLGRGNKILTKIETLNM